MPRPIVPSRRRPRPRYVHRGNPEQAAQMQAHVAERRLVHLSRPQLTVFRCSKRFRVIVAGRRFGKTHLACYELLRAALARPGSLCWYVAPTYGMARDLAWYVLLRIIPPEYIGIDKRGQPAISEGRLEITLRNGSRIALKGANNPRSLHGRGVWFAVLDEFADLDETVLFEAIIPALADHGGSCLCIGTPKGFNYAYGVFRKAFETHEDGTPAHPDWAAFTFRTIEGGRVSAEEIARARANLTAEMFAQQFLASFTRLAGRVYAHFHAGLAERLSVGRRSGNVDPQVQDDPNRPLLVGMDFNVNPMSAVLGVRRMTPNGAELHVFKELLVPSSNTEAVADEIRRYAGDRRPVLVCPDASGRQRKSSATYGVTDFTILERFGFVVSAPAANPHWTDRVNATNAMMRAGDKRRRCKISPRCAQLITSLSGYTYQKNTSIPDKSGGLDHITDALGYLIWQEFNDFLPTWQEGSYR